RVFGTTTLSDSFRVAGFSPWAEVVAHDGRRVTLRGFLYRVPDGAAVARAAGAEASTALDDPDAWLPLPPAQARIAFTVLGDRRSVAAVAPDSSRLRTQVRVAPNPARGGCRVFGAPGSRILCVDLAGRAVRFATLDPDRGEFSWDGRDAFGQPVRPGLYF